MSEKRVKAWAVVDKRGELIWSVSPWIYQTRLKARNERDYCYKEGRVVPVEIVIQEEK